MGNALPVISKRQIVHRRNVFGRRLEVTVTTFPSINRMNAATTIPDSTGTGSRGIKGARRKAPTSEFTPAIIIKAPRVEILTTTSTSLLRDQSKLETYVIESFRIRLGASFLRFFGLGRLWILGQRRWVSSAVRLRCLLLLTRPSQK